MRRVQKAATPVEFAAWTESGNEDWQPCYGDLRQPLKGLVHDALLAEQGHVCCYCERRIVRTYAGTGDSHIEHLIPQSIEPDRALDYANMLCSCNSTNNEHCGGHRGNQDLAVHPLQADCERAFVYGSDGSVRAASESAPKATTTIKALGLDCASLRRRRKLALDDFFTTVSILPPTDWRMIAKMLLDRNERGEFIPHAFTVFSIVDAIPSA
ncbi:MAG: retron system putative HNH endonuclease [Planctomycetota bacterium]